MKAILGTAQAATEHFDDYRNCVPFYAAKGKHSGNPGRIPGRLSVAVDAPAQRNGVPFLFGQSNFAPGYHAGGHVENKRPVALGRNGHRERIGTNYSLLSAGGRHSCGSVGHGNANHAVFSGQLRVKRGVTKVVSAPNRGKAKAVFFGAFDAKGHGTVGSRHAYGVVAIQQ